MNEEVVFANGEGDHWFERNKKVLQEDHMDDWPIQMLRNLNYRFGSVIEVGCSNGWRLERLRNLYYPDKRFVGIDISQKAIEEGQQSFPKIELYQGSLSKLPIQDKFDVVFCQMVLHWVERKHLFQAISEIDRVTAPGGILILGDFFPDFNQKRKYHHLPDKEVFTYKQEYAKIFVSSGLYKEVYAISCGMKEYDKGVVTLSDSDERIKCVVLQKQKNDELYPEVR